MSKHFFVVALVTLFFLASSGTTLAATLQISPNTGVYTSGSIFTVRAVLNTSGAAINAAEGTLRFNPQELSVVSVDRSASIFNLWVTEPTFSNSAGTISFSGGLPSGYTGAAGNIFSVTFRANAAATARLSYTDGAVLANDGRGTNIVSAMNGGTYTVQAPSNQPSAEVIAYIAPANTPGAPRVRSETHNETRAFSKETTATLAWTLPAGITQVRTLLDQNPSSIPTRVYETPISSITLEDLKDGVSYFHIQFRNEEGWGKVAHFPLAIDSTAPLSFTPSLTSEADLSSPVQTILLTSTDATSKVLRYIVRVNNNEPYEFLDESEKKLLTLETLPPGYHTILLEAFDEAGNSLVNSLSFTISAFEKPRFTEFPSQINEEVIPVLYGETRPNAVVVVTVTKLGSDGTNYTTTANETGRFTFIPEGTFTEGVYELFAVATDSFGAISEPSEKIRIAVQRPGYIQIGEKIISVLSVVIPLTALSLVLVGLFIYAWLYGKRLRRRVGVESGEAMELLTLEYEKMTALITENRKFLLESKRTKKLSATEENMFTNIEEAIHASQKRVLKEVRDIELVVGREE